ncbi:copper amine oxidase [Pelomyxa schiedti]|nr:copper amine oxidase [Pelomyxa schiedti]
MMRGCTVLAVFVCVASALWQEQLPATTTGGPSSGLIPADDYAVIQKYAEAYMSGTYHGINAETAHSNLTNFFVLDVRGYADYCLGHVPGAINIPFAELGKQTNLDKLPSDQQILVVCYTGHSASQATSILGLMGYDAWAMSFGMVAWRDKTLVNVYSSKDAQLIYGGNYEQTVGCDP